MRLRPSLLIDVVMASCMTVTAVYMMYHPPEAGLDWRPADPLGAALMVVAHLPLAVRRRFPVAVLLIVCAASGIYLHLRFYHSIPSFAIALAVFSIASYRPHRVSLAGAALGMVVLAYGVRLAGPNVWVAATIVSFFVAVAWGFGESMRQVGEQGRRLADLTDRLRREQEGRARHAVAQEQRRIARELHDVVAHHMSVISVQAGLGRYVFDSDPAMAKAALGTVATTAHEALSEMRRLLHILRVPAEDPESDEAPYESAPGVDRIPELLGRMRLAGAEVELKVSGERMALQPGMDLSVYRVVQECMTNVLKYADPPIATVELDWRPDSLTVRVLDGGRSLAGPEDSSGHGLIGMRERARLYGGTLEAGPRPEGGFAVVLTLPLMDEDEDE
ncbi:sensor histidine kinase [Allorhizocola rhizosphaerae]|uniref:sensor histidine kinase n=1 Tax=Allorhizocola rhizosphaerae TaxID=1872709 RepID=UPI001B8D57DA|nr:sensor histidine kinase [Allorhizocola rhizosphaerae]